MDIKTQFGIAHNVKIEPYGHNTYSLGYVADPDNAPNEYTLLGFDAPTKDDPHWRFWVEVGTIVDGDEEWGDTLDAGLTQRSKDTIYALYEKYKGVIIDEDYVEDAEM